MEVLQILEKSLEKNKKNDEEKSLIRRKMILCRNSLSSQERIQKSEHIIQTVKLLEEYRTAELLLLYASFQSEVITDRLISMALEEGKHIALPCSNISNGIPHMDFYEITSMRQLKNGYKGIREPDFSDAEVKYVSTFADKTVMLMPGVAFDHNRSRIGYGMGFYDRFLEQHCNMTTIAAAYECQLVDSIPCSKYDYRPDKLVTEERVYE